MADMISRLKLESGEFDSKIARATKGLLTMEKECREVGGTLEILDKEQLEFVKGLGQMETVSQNAKGKIAELTSAFTELSVQYNRLTKEEKNGDYGRALASSLDQLKTRIKDSKSELAGVEGKLSGFGDVANAVGSKLGIPVSALSGVGAAAAAAGAALKVAKDAFMNTEGGIDEWGRTVEGAKGAYSVFLDTLNNGNWSHFFSNLSNAITGSRKLYDEMDRLSSIKANNAAAIAKEQATIQELRLRQQKGENVAEELRAAEERLRKLQAESSDQGKLVGREQMKQAITNSVNSIKGNGSSFLGINFRKDTTAKVSEEQINAAIDEILNNGQAAMDKYAQAFKDLQTKGTKTWTETQYSQGGVAYQVTKSEFDINQLSAEEQALYKLSKAITDTESKLQAGIQTYTSALQEEAGANREAFQTERFAQKGDRQASKAQEKTLTPLEEAQKKISELTNEALTADEDRKEAIKQEIAGLQEQVAEYKKIQDYVQGITKQEKSAPQITGPSGYSQEGISALRSEIQSGQKSMQMGSSEYMFEAERLVDLTTFENLMKTAVANGIQIDPAMLEGLFEQIDNATFSDNALELVPSVSDEAWATLVDTINEKLADLGLDPIEIDVKTGGVKNLEKEVEKTTNHVAGAAAAFSALGNAMGQIEDPGAKVAGMIAEAIGSVAAGYGAATAQAAEMGPWAWIAFAVTGLATMFATIAGIKQATSGAYAEGGIIPGNSFSGDNLTANVNSGELILNRAQQDNIASQLQGNAGGGQITGSLTGSTIYFALANYAKQNNKFTATNHGVALKIE